MPGDVRGTPPQFEAPCVVVPRCAEPVALTLTPFCFEAEPCALPVADVERVVLADVDDPFVDDVAPLVRLAVAPPVAFAVVVREDLPAVVDVVVGVVDDVDVAGAVEALVPELEEVAGVDVDPVVDGVVDVVADRVALVAEPVTLPARVAPPDCALVAADCSAEPA
jgi:hypothetical protein